MSAVNINSARETGVTPGGEALRWDVRGCVLGVALLLMWVSLTRLLSAQWEFFDQYRYGWAVPFLCAYSLWTRHQRSAAADSPTGAMSSWGGVAAIVIAGLLMIPSRVVQEANPIWRAASYALSFELLVISFAVVFLAGGWRWVKLFAFPLLFFLTAVPWPSGPESALIEALTSLNTGTVVELLGWLSVPAIQHGNVIEIATGQVGVDEACSGIRSFQATLMISLALGELYSLPALRRCYLLAGGLVVAMVFNIARTLTLVLIAAKSGSSAVTKWHDSAGVTVLLGCFFTLWFLTLWLQRKRASSNPSTTATALASPPAHKPDSAAPMHFTDAIKAASMSLGRVPGWLGVGLMIWVVGIEMGTGWWFARSEQRVQLHPPWQVRLPAEDGRFKNVEFSEAVTGLLRYDEGRSVQWRDDAGRAWQMFYFQWNPGTGLHDRVRVATAKAHRPERCLTGSGMQLISEAPPETLTVGALKFSFRKLTFSGNGRPVHVFFCLWEEGTEMGQQGNVRETPRQRLAAAWAGNRGLGQRSIEAVVLGFSDLEEAFAEFQRYLRPMVLMNELKPGTPGN